MRRKFHNKLILLCIFTRIDDTIYDFVYNCNIYNAIEIFHEKEIIFFFNLQNYCLTEIRIDISLDNCCAINITLKIILKISKIHFFNIPSLLILT